MDSPPGRSLVAKIMLYSVEPECRFCGTGVEFFGDVCADCEEVGAEVNALAAADQAALNDLRDAADGI